MRKFNKLFSLLLVITIIASSVSGSVNVKAETRKITNFSLINYLDTNYSKNPYVSFEVEQTYALDIVMSYGNSVFSKNLSGEEGFTFISKDTSIVTVGKSNGCLFGKKVGTTSVMISYPGLSSKTIDVTITPVHDDSQARKDHATINTIEELSKLEFKPEEIVEYHKKICNLNYEASMTKKDHFISIPNAYKMISIYKPFRDYLAEKKALYTSNNAVNIVNISKLTSDSMTVELDRMISTEDLISYSSAYDTTYSPDMKLKIGLYFYTGNETPFAKGNKFVALKKASIGLNDNTVTVDIRNLLKSNKKYRVGFYLSNSLDYGKTTENECIVSKGLEFTAK